MAASPYHHGHLREDLVSAAVSAVRERGPDAMVLRELARTVGVSHNAAYRHFAQREDLVAEVALHGMNELVRTMTDHLAAVDTAEPVLRARRRLAQIGRGYVAFAISEPGLFRVAFASHPSTTIEQRNADPGPYGLLTSVLDELVEVGFLAAGARPHAEALCWSAVHGFSQLHIDGPLRDSTEAERHQALEILLASIDRSYAATTGSPAAPGDLVLAQP